MIIYIHTSKTSRKSYVGKTTKNVEERLNEHVKHARNDNIKTTHFHNALLKYGVEDFETRILEENVSNELINERETHWINEYNTYKGGYNSTLGGDGTNGYKQTPEHKEKIRLKNLGQKRTDEQRQRMSEAHMGQEAWNKGMSLDVPHLHEKIKCPHCDKIGTIGPMKQWHFDKCKNKKE